MLELERPAGLYSKATKSLKAASLDYQLDARVESEVRVSHLLQSLDELTEKWNPKLVALCQPSGINWPVPALDLLLTSLAEWSARRDLPQFSYTVQEVRTAIAGHPNASRDQLGYVCHHAAVGTDWPGTLYPRVGSHRRWPLSPDERQAS